MGIEMRPVDLLGPVEGVIERKIEQRLSLVHAPARGWRRAWRGRR